MSSIIGNPIPWPADAGTTSAWRCAGGHDVSGPQTVLTLLRDTEPIKRWLVCRAHSDNPEPLFLSGLTYTAQEDVVDGT